MGLVRLVSKAFVLVCCLFVVLVVIGAFVPHQPGTAKGSEASVAPPIDPHDLAISSTKITKFSWRKEAFGSVMLATFTLKNSGQVDVKDIEIKCDHYAHSGTLIDSNDRTLYEIVRAGETRTFHDFDMGFIDPQVSNSGCEIENLAINR